MKKYSTRFWVLFWSFATVFLVAWYFFCQIHYRGAEVIDAAIDYLPFDRETKEDYKTIAYFSEYLFKKDNQEKTFLILFQNNLELRPGGGYIGSFGILKVMNGDIIRIETHDLSNFDARVPDGIAPPYPMAEMLHISSWKLRDSNYSPDNSVNAKKADEFYHMGQGQENFDGVIAINTNVLQSFLEVTGPVEVEGYPGTYDSQNAIVSLEYQVEQGAYKQKIERGERKAIMGELASIILAKAKELDNSKKMKLAQEIFDDLNNKDIQLYFKDPLLQSKAESAGWAGLVDQNWNNDYLMMVDANLGALKSDYYMKRSFEYVVDFSKEKPEAHLSITYTHTGIERDFMTKDYVTYLRVYVPQDSWLYEKAKLDATTFGNDLNKKYFGSIFGVNLEETKTIEMKYYLPVSITEKDYNLLIQKQSGVGEINGKVKVIHADGTVEEHGVNLKKDWRLR